MKLGVEKVGDLGDCFFKVRLGQGVVSDGVVDDSVEVEDLRVVRGLREELDAGGLAVGMGIVYAPGATHSEVIDMFRLAAERRLPDP